MVAPAEFAQPGDEHQGGADPHSADEAERLGLVLKDFGFRGGEQLVHGLLDTVELAGQGAPSLGAEFGGDRLKQGLAVGPGGLLFDHGCTNHEQVLQITQHGGGQRGRSRAQRAAESV